MKFLIVVLAFAQEQDSKSPPETRDAKVLTRKLKRENHVHVCQTKI